MLGIAPAWWFVALAIALIVLLLVGVFVIEHRERLYES